jgi:ribose/xylose/arabinose/galactoside ABC-type transport system permease subunit
MWCAVALASFAVFRVLARVVPAGGDARRSAAIRAALVVAVLALLFAAANLRRIVDHTSWVVALVVLVGLGLWLLLEMTTYGRHLRATGANREAARLAGVRVRREVVKSFVLGSVLAAVVLGASQGSAAPGVGATFLLPAFAAAFLSTVVLSTGRFTVWGTILGGIFVVWISQGLIIGGVPPQWTDVVNGVVLVSAVALSASMRRQRS